MFPLEKYKYFTNGKDKVVAVQTFAGKKYKGVAYCAHDDKFDYEVGKKLAALRCNMAICTVRKKLATRDANAIRSACKVYLEWLKSAEAYEAIAIDEYNEATKALKNLVAELA